MPTTSAPNLRDLGGELSGAASNIENALARLGVEQHQQIAAVLPHEGMAGLVEFGVPVSGVELMQKL